MQKRQKAIEFVPERISKHVNEGLSSIEVERRIAEGLINKTKKKNSKSYMSIIIGNVFTFFNLLGILVFFLMVALGSTDNMFFFIVILLNLFLGIYQEIRAKISLEKLSLMTAPAVTVIRDGKQTEIDVNDVVLDDIMLLESGKQIVADAVVQSGEVEVNEALLTGESDAIRKKPGALLLSGSFIVSGCCYARVENVGEKNYIETLSAQAKKYQKPKSELMRSIKAIVNVLAVLIVPLAIATFFTTLNSSTYSKITKTLMLGNLKDNVVLALEKTAGSVIGMIPAGMVLLTTAALAVSVIRLTQKNALVQDLYCIEMLARVNVLCLDKTGTITDGTMKVDSVEVIKELNISFRSMMSNYCRAVKGNNASALALLDEFGAESYNLKENCVLSFSSERKLSAVSFSSFGSVVVGAPEFVLKQDEKLIKRIKRHTQEGKRVLLVAHSKKTFKDDFKLPKDLKPCGIIVIEDNIRQDAPEIIKWFNENDVEIRVISGDNAHTVASIAKKVGIANADRYISVEGMGDAELISNANKYIVFGRVNPDQKALLIKAIKASGKTVAMTGDGVNDVLAMKQADCAVAIAAGSEAARSVAHLVLTDSKFSSMPNVVREGRRVVNNIQNASSLFLMKTMMTVLVTVLMLILQKAYPFEPSNLYPIEFFIIGMPAFVLALRPNTNLIKGKFLKNTLIRAIPSGIALALSVGIIYAYGTTHNLFGLAGNDVIITLATLAMTVAGFVSLTILCYPYNALGLATIVGSGILTLLCFSIPYTRRLTGITAVNGHLWILFITIIVSALIICGGRVLQYYIDKKKDQIPISN